MHGRIVRWCGNQHSPEGAEVGGGGHLKHAVNVSWRVAHLHERAGGIHIRIWILDLVACILDAQIDRSCSLNHVSAGASVQLCFKDMLSCNAIIVFAHNREAIHVPGLEAERVTSRATRDRS